MSKELLGTLKTMLNVYSFKANVPIDFAEAISSISFFPTSQSP